MDDSNDRPWARRKDETAHAYERFGLYLLLGPKRSLEKLRRELGKGKYYLNQLKRWSSRFDWVERARAYDTHDLELKMEARAEMRERGRQKFVEAAEGLTAVILQLCLDQDTPPSVRLSAARDGLDRAGLVAPRRYELTAPKGTNLDIQLKRDAAQLSDEQLDALCEILGEPSQDE